MNKYQKTIELTGVKYLAYVLAISYVVSLLGQYHWIADLFSHFKLIYAAGGLVLSLLLLGIKRFRLCALCFLIAVSSFTETRMILDDPFRFTGDADKKGFVIVQYNHFYPNTDFTNFKAWLLAQNHLDVIVVQEAGEKTVRFVQTLKEIYPYQIHDPMDNRAFGMVILSKHPFKSSRKIDIDGGPYFKNFMLKIEVEYSGFNAPINIYTIHTLPPMGDIRFKQRNTELALVAKEIAQDKGPYKVLIGDLNISPFSPYFQALKRDSGLGFQSTGLLLNPTWPSGNSPLFLLQIPIDHVLQSKSLKVLSKQVGPSFGSDHHILITSLGVRD